MIAEPGGRSLWMVRSPLVREAAAAVGLACAVAVVIVLFVLVPQKRDADLAVLETEAAGIARLFASLTPPTPDFAVMAGALIEPFYEQSRMVGIATFDADGTPWFAIGDPEPELRATLAEVRPDTALARRGSDPRYLDLAWAMTFNTDAERRYVFVARMDAQGVSEALSAFTMRSVAATVGIGLALALATVLYLGRRILRPVLTLKERMLAAADDPRRPELYTLSVAGHGASEIGAMAESFNTMLHRMGDNLERLQRKERKLRKAKDQAEHALTELRTTQSQLIEAEKMAALGGLVAGVAHEINTPVGNALGAISHLERRAREVKLLFDDGKLKKPDAESFFSLSLEASGIALSNIDRASALVQSFKQVAVDRTADQRRRFHLRAYVEELLLSLRPQLRRTPHRIDVAIGSGIEMDSYPGALAQVLTNVLMNATVHAFADGQAGTLRIDAQSHGGRRVRIRVSDDGNGIPPDVLPRIFEPFFTTRRGAGGTGLGLHIAYNIVTRQLGGMILADSTPGQGTTFTLDLPASAPAEARAPAEALASD